MPILVPPTVDTPDQTGNVAPINYAATQWVWTSPGGSERRLNSTHPYLLPGGVDGHMAAPVTILDSRPALMDGGVWRSQRYEPRDVMLGLMAHTRDSVAWRDTYRDVVADFDTSTAAGMLTAAHPDGSTRSLMCHYVSGLESPVDGEPGAVKFGTFVVALRAYDPWWRGPAETVVLRSAEGSPFLPGPPFTILPQSSLGPDSTLRNPGDAEAFPVWRVDGPCTSVTMRRSSDGAAFTVNEELGVGDWLTVDTDPRAPVGQKIVRDNGTNLWGVATTDFPNLWAIPGGNSSFTAEATGLTSATTITVNYNPRYRTS